MPEYVYDNTIFTIELYSVSWEFHTFIEKQGEKNVQGVPQSQTEALSRHQKDKTKQTQIEQTYEKHQD